MPRFVVSQGGSFGLVAAVAAVVAAAALSSMASCSDQACIRWSADRGACPSGEQAEALMELACGRVSSVDGEAELDEDLCCYDVTYDERRSNCIEGTVGSGVAASGSFATATSTGSGGSCDGSGFCSTCVACAEAGGCADEKLTCDSNPSCATLRPCVEACAQGDDACIDACRSGHQQGIDDLRALYACLICDVCQLDCGAATVCADL